MEVFETLHAFSWFNPSANNCNAYFIDGEKRILIDPGHYHLFEHVREGLSRLSLKAEDMDVIIITHGHPDHLEGARLFAGTSTLIAMHALELDFIRNMAPHYGEALGIKEFEPQILLRDGELHIGNVRFLVIHTPGHSPGSICLYWPEKKALFTGDVVFRQGVGRTDLPGGNGQALKDSIQKISGLDVEYLLPGHGDLVSGHQSVKKNFTDIASFWFSYL